MAFTFADLITDTVRKVENRATADDQLRILSWLRDSLIEISSNRDFRNEFLELELWGPVKNLTSAQQEYADSFFVSGSDINWTTLDILLWTDYPTNSVRRQLDMRNYQLVDRYSPTTGEPSFWYRFGTNIGFYPVPDKNYQVQARILKFHPINDANLSATTILLPRDWNEIISYAAAERGFIELEEPTKASAIHSLLFGDAKYPNRPGLVSGRKMRREQENWRRESRLSPMSRPYSFRRS